MVSPREGQEKFGRNLETENPDYDRYFAKLATDLLKPEQIDKGNAFRKRNVVDRYDPQRAAANIVMSMNKKMRKREAIDVKAKKLRDDGILSDNIKARVPPGSKEKSREKQTPEELKRREGFYDFSGKLPPKEIKKHGKIYRRK